VAEGTDSPGLWFAIFLDLLSHLVRRRVRPTHLGLWGAGPLLVSSIEKVPLLGDRPMSVWFVPSLNNEWADATRSAIKTEGL
jgi:hypothetical protein